MTRVGGAREARTPNLSDANAALSHLSYGPLFSPYDGAEKGDMATFVEPDSPFWKYVDVRGPDDCWLWMRYCDRDGYGRFRSQSAHRVAWELANGPTSLHVLHDCDNPRCCNPRHLHTGTQQDNMRERSARGRVPHGPAHYKYKPELHLGTPVRAALPDLYWSREGISISTDKAGR